MNININDRERERWTGGIDKESRSLYATRQGGHPFIYNTGFLLSVSDSQAGVHYTKTRAPTLCHLLLHRSYISHLTVEQMPVQSEEPHGAQKHSI